MPAKFILVRHAEGTHNLAAETEGDAAYRNPLYKDASLTDKGMGQAQDAGVKIAELWPTVAAVWCSPLTRCLQTATHILESVKVPVDEMYVHEYLIERQRTGDICNRRKTETEIQEAWPAYKVSLSHEPVQEGETEGAVHRRISLLLEHLRRKYANSEEPVLIVTHFEVLYELFGRAFTNAEFVVWE
jgi:broad specificity phosphatase PhoE